MIEHMNSECDCRVDGHHIGKLVVFARVVGAVFAVPGGLTPFVWAYPATTWGLSVQCVRKETPVDDDDDDDDDDVGKQTHTEGHDTCY